MAQVILVRRIFVLFCVVKIERGLKLCQRGFALDSAFCFLEDFQAIPYH